MGISRFVASKPNVVRSNITFSEFCRNYFERPLPVHDGQLARLDMHSPGCGYQLHPGFPPKRVTCVTLAASISLVADFSASGRYSSENRCGAEFNGSVLPVPSHRMYSFFHHWMIS